MDNQLEIENLQNAIRALESQRSSLSDQVVETALAPLREKLVSLQSIEVGEQRKQVTILFSDLVSFTSLSTQVDAEELRDILNQYFAAWNTCIKERGGIVEKYIGDAVLAVFGLPASHEDDPERAVLAALDMAGQLPEVNLSLLAQGMRPLQMRVGIHTGDVVVGAFGERQKDEFVAVGEAVNLASRVQSAAPLGGILVTGDTHRQVHSHFQTEYFGDLELKGIDRPVPAYLVHGKQSRSSGSRQQDPALPEKMVGREKELSALQERFRSVLAARKPHFLVLNGEAGIGKSRLVAEFLGWARKNQPDTMILTGRSSSITQNSPYDLLRELFSAHLNILDSDPPEVVRRKLEAGWQQVDSSESAGDVRAAHYVGRLLGFELGESSPAQLDPYSARGFSDQALIDLRSYFRLLAKKGPLLMVLEDLHWADDSSLDFVERIVDAFQDLPVLILGTARPTLWERRPGWGGAALPRLDLVPLSPENSADLVHQVVGDTLSLPAALAELILTNADGNPFYIEEIVKMLIDEGRIASNGDAGKAGEPVGFHVPSTLVGVLQARFDSLSSKEKIQLQRSSVFGRSFWDRAVAYIDANLDPTMRDDPGFQTILDQLQAREMVFVQDHSTFDGTAEYLFKHALLRDVTYESLLKRQRKAYNHLAASWLEEMTEQVQRTGEFAARIAGHYELSGERDAAARWYWLAGKSAALRYANSEALYAFSRALELCPQDAGDMRFQVLLAREAVYSLLGQIDERKSDLDELDQIASRLDTPDVLAQVRYRHADFSFSQADLPPALEYAGQAVQYSKQASLDDIRAESLLIESSALMRQGSFDASFEKASEALSLAEEIHSFPIQAKSQRQLGMITYYTGKPLDCLPYFQKAHDLCQLTGDRQGQAMALNNLGGSLLNAGDYPGAKEYYEQALEVSRQIGDLPGLARSLNNLGIISVTQANYEQAEKYYLEALEISRKMGQRSFIGIALDNLGNLATYRYEYSQARSIQKESFTLGREIGDKVLESFALHNYGQTSLLAGNFEDALRYLKEAEKYLDELGDQSGKCNLTNSFCLYSLLSGDPARAEQLARKAHELSQQYQLRAEEGLADMYLGRACFSQGKLEESTRFLQEAIQIFEETESNQEIIEGKASLLQSLWAAGRLEDCAAMVTDILYRLDINGPLGIEQPGFVYTVCYQVLSAMGDPRARDTLEQGYRLIEQIAAKFSNEDERRMYQENLPGNRSLMDAWQLLPAYNDLDPHRQGG